MQVLFIVTLGVTALSGAVALGSLFYFTRLSHKTLDRLEERAGYARKRLSKRARAAELDRREQFVASYYAQANAELSEKRAALARIARRAANASAALDRALLSGRLDLNGSAYSPRKTAASARAQATPFELSAFDDLGAERGSQQSTRR